MKIRPSHIVVIVACAGLALAANHWWQGRPVDARQSDSLSMQSDLNAQRMQETLTERLADKPLGDEQERMDSPAGLALSRKCAEWAEFSDNQPSEIATANMKKACSDYRRYVETGELPE